MTSWPTNWVNWVTTFVDRWQLFTLWTCRRLDVELSWVELCHYKHPFSLPPKCRKWGAGPSLWWMGGRPALHPSPSGEGDTPSPRPTPLGALGASILIPPFWNSAYATGTEHFQGSTLLREVALRPIVASGDVLRVVTSPGFPRFETFVPAKPMPGRPLSRTSLTLTS